MKSLFLAYRNWAFDVYDVVKRNPLISNDMPLLTTRQELNSVDLNEYDVLITCGWSEELGTIADHILAIGTHCAALDRYSYGTPIQNQVIDGIKFSKQRLFKFTSDANLFRAHVHTREYSHEVDLDLTGNIDDIFKQMTATSITLFNMFLYDYPNIEWKVWDAEDGIRKVSRVPADSVISIKKLASMTTEELYDLVRCLQDPYPNLCIDDEVGRLFIKQAEFKRK